MMFELHFCLVISFVGFCSGWPRGCFSWLDNQSFGGSAIPLPYLNLKLLHCHIFTHCFRARLFSVLYFILMSFILSPTISFCPKWHLLHRNLTFGNILFHLQSFDQSFGGSTKLIKKLPLRHNNLEKIGEITKLGVKKTHVKYISVGRANYVFMLLGGLGHHK